MLSQGGVEGKISDVSRTLDVSAAAAPPSLSLKVRKLSASTTFNTTSLTLDMTCPQHISMDPTLSPDSKKLSIRPDFDSRLSYAASVRPASSTPDSARPTTADSPLTRQEAPNVFEPKVVGLYKRLFRVGLSCVRQKQLSNSQQEVEDDDKPEGFWAELFLLKPDAARLRQILEDTDAEYLIHLQVRLIANALSNNLV